MRIAFHILRMNWYRLLAPVIDEAMRRGNVVECWHNVGNKNLGSNVINIAKMPKFRYGSPSIRDYSGMKEFLKLVKSNNVDAIVDMFPPLAKDPDGNNSEPQLLMKEWPPSGNRPYWIMLDALPGDCMITVRNEEQLFACDLFLLRSEFWLDFNVRSMSVDLSEHIQQALSDKTHSGRFHLEFMKQRQRFRWSSKHEKYFREHSQYIGYPMVDPYFSINPQEVRRSFGIPRDIPVVLHLPSPYGNGNMGIWEKMYSNSRMPKRLLLAMLAGRWEYVKNAFAPSHDEAVVNAIACFCKKNKAFLLCKRRHSQVVCSYVKRNASLIVGDESHYPHTMVSALAIADLCVGSYSATVYEAVAQNVFFLNIDIPFFPASFVENYLPIEEIYNFGGATASWNAASFAKAFSQMSLKDFKIVPESRQAFNKKYNGPVDGRSSGRFMECVEALVKNGRVDPA
jgi:hypothetical protein